MASTIKLKNGSGAPTTGDLVQGEPALDLTNKRLYTENASGVVIEVGTNPSTIDINAGTIDGTVIGGSTAAAITGTTITGTSFVSSGDMTFGDSDKAIFGAGSDLQIYHDGSNSRIQEAGTGNLIIRADDFRVQSVAGESYIEADANGAVALRYDNALKLATTATGIDVTGTIASSGNLEITSSVPKIILTDSNNPSGQMEMRGANTEFVFDFDPANAENNSQIDFKTDGSRRLLVKSTGIDVTGTVTADGLTVDAGASDIAIVFDDNSVTNRYQFTTGGNSLDSYFNINSGSARAAHLKTVSGSVFFDIASGFGRNDISFTGADLFIKRGGTKALEVDQATGDLSLFEDTGTTAKFFWDASAESLGIGTSSPSYPFHVTGSGDTVTAVTAGASSIAALNLGNSTNLADGGIRYDNGADALILRASNAERLRIDSSGNVILAAGTGTLQTATAGTSNLRLGVNAGNSIIAGGNYNVVVGDEAGTALTTGDYNTALGYQAGASVTTGTNNTLIGGLAGDALTTGSSNVAVGYNALTTDDVGQWNVAIGRDALANQNIVSAANTYNTAVGGSAGAAITTGFENTLIGGLAGDAITTASNNTAVGKSALSANTTASNNTAVGYAALTANTTGTQNVAVGSQSLLAHTTGNYNVAVGQNALVSNTTASDNTSVGAFSLDANTTGANNTAVGKEALGSNTTAR
jgi:hypothetical protein